MKLSRIQITQREQYQFDHGNPRYFALYGRNDPPKAGDKIYVDDPDYANWIKIGEFESVKPSGLPIGTTSDEDLTYARRGEDFEIDAKAEAYQYYRVEMLKNWSGANYICFMEFKMWGKPDGFEFPK